MGGRGKAIRSVAWAALVFAAACTDPVGDSDEFRASVVGSYRAGGSFGAFVLTTIANGVETDWLSKGAFIELELRENGTTQGRLFAPGADEDGSDFDANLVGTWTIRDQRIELAHDADTFLRDMELVRSEDGSLRGDETFGDERVVVALARR